MAMTGFIEFHNVYTTPGAVDILWEMLEVRSEERDPLVNISHRSLTSRTEHEAFVSSNTFPIWYLVRSDGEWLGYVSLTERNEISIMLLPWGRGKGFGARVLRKFIAEVEPFPAKPSVRSGHFVANINPANERSQRLFRRAGFELIQHTYRLEP